MTNKLSDREPRSKVAVCGHIVRGEAALMTITNDLDGYLHFLCEKKHLWETADNDSVSPQDVDLFATYLDSIVSQCDYLNGELEIPKNHVAYFSRETSSWVVAPLATG